MNSPEKIYDVAVIGGGIAGAGIAREASMRGLSVVLFEKNTFGSGTSSKSSKLIHGGIRYLEISWKALRQGRFGECWKNFCFVFHALKEAQILEKIAPDLVKPLPILIPIYDKKGRGAFEVYFGVFVYYLMALFSGSARKPVIHSTPEKILKVLPGLRKDGLRGGVVIWDRVTDDKALTQKTLSSAVKHGALAYEHSEVLSCRYDEKQGFYVVGVRLGNVVNEFRARKVVDATGAWIDSTRKMLGEYDHDIVSPIAGCHIELKKFAPMSVLLQAKDDRIFFCIHVGEIARVGTTERTHHDPDHVYATDEEIDYLLKSLGFYFPEMKFGRESILTTDAGVRPLVRPDKAVSDNETSREHRFRLGPSGILHIVGVKLTDHRRAAEEAVNRLVRDLAKNHPSIKPRSGTADETL